MKKIIMFILFILNLTSCTSYSYKDKIDNLIIIDKININDKYSIGSLNDNIEGIVMFDECGRPDIVNSNTVIGAHSGLSSKAYFNEISKLEINDEILILYDNREYSYHVIQVLEVEDTDIGILYDTDESILTLLSCKMGDSSKRIVVIAKLMENIDK